MIQRVRLIQDEKPAKRKSVGLRSTLTPQLSLQFCNLIKMGLPPDGACDYLCISNTAFHTWMRKGQEWLDADGVDVPAENEQFAQFVLSFRKATGEYRFGLVKDLHEAKGPGWIKNLAILERRDRKSFGRREQRGGGDESYQPDDSFL